MRYNFIVCCCLFCSSCTIAWADDAQQRKILAPPRIESGGSAFRS